MEVLSVFNTPFINPYACLPLRLILTWEGNHLATVRALRRHISLYSRSNLFGSSSPSLPFGRLSSPSKTWVIQYSANFVVVSLSPRLRNKSNVPIRIHDCAMRHTIAQGSTLSLNAKRFGRTVNARALVVGMPIAFKYSEIRNSLIEARRTAFPSLSSDP